MFSVLVMPRYLRTERFPKYVFTEYLIYLFTVLDNMFLTAVRHEVNNLESSVVVQELEFAINLAVLVFYGV